MRTPRGRIWGLAMDPTRARIVRKLGRADDAPAELVLRAEARHLRVIMSGKPGQSFSSQEGCRQAASGYGHDPLAEDERQFVRQVALLLDAHRRAGEFDALVLCAAEDMIGRLRQDLPAALRDLIAAEVSKNLLHLSEGELPRIMAQELEKFADHS